MKVTIPKIKHVGRIMVADGVIEKQYTSTTACSSYKKIPCDIIVMYNEGYRNIKLVFSKDYPYIHHVKEFGQMMRAAMPIDLNLMLVKKRK